MVITRLFRRAACAAATSAIVVTALSLGSANALASDHGGSDHGESADDHGDHGEHGEGHGGGHGEPAAAYDPTRPRPFEVGDIYIRNFRPTHNEIANIRFTLHVVFKQGTSDAVMAEMSNWRRRLRDQAITAARSATAEDLSEPGLDRVRKLMLLRIRRLPLPQEAIGVYLTDFAVGSG